MSLIENIPNQDLNLEPLGIDNDAYRKTNQAIIILGDY